MDDLVACPACGGRGSYCLRVMDPTTVQLSARSQPCELCHGFGKIALADVEEYDLSDRTPYFPYRPTTTER